MKTGVRPLTLEYCLPPSCGFPPKSFPLEREPTISGDTFGTRARGRPRTAPPRRRHVMPLAMRPLREKSGALPTHVSSALLAGRLHFELDNVGSGDVTLGVFVKLPRRALIRGVTEYDETSFEDVITRRSPKRSQAAQPPLERRGALRDLASKTDD